MSDEEVTGHFPDGGQGDVTGEHTDLGARTITCVVGQYRVKVLLTADGRFVDILEIGLSQEFMDYRLKGMSRGFEDVERFYQEDEQEG